MYRAANFIIIMILIIAIRYDGRGKYSGQVFNPIAFARNSKLWAYA